MDNMIEYMNKRYQGKWNLFYSTPSQYIDAVAKYDVEWPTRFADMFPYADSKDAYWTGFYSSRPNDKEYVRRASHNFDASNQLYAQKVLDQQIDDSDLSEIMDAQYHMLDVLGIL
jgi:hypothetical protein